MSDDEFSSPPRKVALADARVVYKCESKKHISVAADLEYRRRVHGPKKVRPRDDDPVHAKMDHDGCDVHTVFVTLGSSPFTPADCASCGGKMHLVGGQLPDYGELPTNAAGLVDHHALLELVTKQKESS